MKRDLTTARAVVETATQDCNTLLDVIAASTTEVEVKKEAAVSQEKTLKVPGCSPVLTFPKFSHVSANSIYMQLARTAFVACGKPHIMPNKFITTLVVQRLTQKWTMTEIFILADHRSQCPGLSGHRKLECMIAFS